MSAYEFKAVEQGVLDLWKDQKTYQKAVEKNKSGKKFFYLDGPPYTTGKIHIGHAWGKALRDSILRYKRMSGFNVWDQPGFDMHGLPIEVSVEKELGIKDKQEIINKIGLGKFIEACEKFALDNLWPMVEDFKRLGVWMNWENPYMTIKNEYIEGAWWALAQAHKRDLLYVGKKSMTWCPRCATALAKHELEYENRKDTSIFVKFPVQGKKGEYLVIWTTTPWTLPFNMAVMVHPEFDYVRAQIGNEVWILAEALAESVISKTGERFTILEKIKGKKLEGTKYEHPFLAEVKFHQDSKEKNHTRVILSDKYVALDAGSGLVHCAPGCGPEDFEVGKQNGLTPFNETDEHGKFPASMGALEGLYAKKDDQTFIDYLTKKGLLAEQAKINHEYAHCWRCKTPVIFRATNQWFLGVEKLREEMQSLNMNIKWNPEWAGQKWFDSWLGSLQDWCISRQRFWGIPLPIWVSPSGDYKVVASREELKKLSGKELENLHRPWIDEITFKNDKGEIMKRVPDVLDVWMDSGVAPWATLNYPTDQKTIKDLGTPDLILEGKDQIRGWFNSLACMSMVSFGNIPYKAVYMHGFINDSQGRKMSKSLKNYITPYEITEVYGADTLRYYQIGGAQPGLDLNFNHEDAKLKHKNLIVFWNLHKFIADLAKELGENPAKMNDAEMQATFGTEEKFLFSKLHSAIKKTTEMFDNYRFNEIPWIIEDLYLAMSRTYIQLVRDKASVGSDEERKTVLYALFKTYTETLKIFAPIAPFITEHLWQVYKKEFSLKEESIHLCDWPKFDKKHINVELEEQMQTAGEIMQAILAGREKAKLSVRWPLKKVIVLSHDKTLLDTSKKMEGLINYQTNNKKLETGHEIAEIKMSIKPNAGPLGKDFGKKSPKIMAEIMKLDATIVLKKIAEEGKYSLKLEDEKIELNKNHFVIERTVPKHLIEVELKQGAIYLDTERNNELDSEGYAREAMRRVQQLRKDSGLQKTDKANVYIQTDNDLAGMLGAWKGKISEKCGATVTIGSIKPTKKHQHTATEKIKDFEITFFLDKQ
jgi:isoleucyl-tRNA synthetase